MLDSGSDDDDDDDHHKQPSLPPTSGGTRLKQAATTLKRMPKKAVHKQPTRPEMLKHALGTLSLLCDLLLCRGFS